MMSEHVDENSEVQGEKKIQRNGTHAHRLPRQFKQQRHAKGVTSRREYNI